jgi:hypothetical protein
MPIETRMPVTLKRWKSEGRNPVCIAAMLVDLLEDEYCGLVGRCSKSIVRMKRRET